MQVPRQGAGLHVLVADDSASTRKFLKAQLERNGYLVRWRETRQKKKKKRACACVRVGSCSFVRASCLSTIATLSCFECSVLYKAGVSLYVLK